MRGYPPYGSPRDRISLAGDPPPLPRPVGVTYVLIESGRRGVRGPVMRVAPFKVVHVLAGAQRWYRSSW